MKKIRIAFLILVIVCFISTINVSADGVSIKSINLVDSTDNVAEINEPTISGLKINFDLAFSNVGDSAKYEVVLNNPTNKEYEINTDKQFSSSNYISYRYELKDRTNRIKANSEVVLYITIKYENVVPTSSLVDGKYIENNTLGMNFLNEDNPETFNNILFIIIMIFLLIIATAIFHFTKNMDLYIIIVSLLLVPITVFALEKLKLTVTTKITIDNNLYDVYYSVGNIIKEEQLDRVDFSDGCNPIKIKNNDDTYEDYLECDSLYVKDKEKHFEGEKITAKNDKINYLWSNNYCFIDNGFKVCPSYYVKINMANDQFSFKCGTDSYIQNSEEKILNKCSEEEFYNITYSSQTFWYDDHGFFSDSAFEFTMPKHDIFIDRLILFEA